MTPVDRMRVATLSYTMRGYLHTFFTLEDRLELMNHARLELDAIGVRDTEHMTYTELLTTCEIILGERTVRAA